MVLFVGDRPAKRSNPNVPFEGASCWPRLKSWISTIGKHPYYIVNQVDKDMIYLARMFAATGTPVIALGNNAAKALKGIPHFKLPHPSGRNRQINNKEFITKILKDCKEYIGGVNDKSV